MILKLREWAIGPFFAPAVCSRQFSNLKTIYKQKWRHVKSSVALVTELIEPTVSAFGLELWGVELIQQGKYSLLRIYIESEDGITIEDCEKVSRQVSALLDVEEPIAGEYTLEVSSPGLDRPLFAAKQFEQYTGSEVSLRMRSPVDGRRKFKGIIIGVRESVIDLQVDGSDFELDHRNVEKANIVFE
ncbi:MAG: ribosome maturation factor RimP [Pseudomonadales bacterium]|nr:ribosome maturation factor RimP [Pseudomonadales bacterium]